MSHIKEASELTSDEIEEVEKLSLRWMYQAVLDFGFTTWDIFRQSPDDVKDVAEDITRELLDALSGYRINQRILGNVDYRKARYVLMPHQTIRQALFVDSKAEKTRNTGTMQMSQLSLRVKQRRAGLVIDEPGMLPSVSVYGATQFSTTTMLLHYSYQDDPVGNHFLETITLAAVPNGLLQPKYNPDEDDTIWLAGRNAPTLGEDFRVRLSFDRLKQKQRWRVQHIHYVHATAAINSDWEE